MTIERVTDENFCERSLDNFNRSQYVNRIYKKFDAEYEIIESEFIIDWSLEKNAMWQEICCQTIIFHISQSIRGAYWVLSVHIANCMTDTWQLIWFKST